MCVYRASEWFVYISPVCCFYHSEFGFVFTGASLSEPHTLIIITSHISGMFVCMWHVCCSNFSFKKHLFDNACIAVHKYEHA